MSVALRRGMPRVKGGEPWPPADAVGPDDTAGPLPPAAPMAPVAAEPSAPVSSQAEHSPVLEEVTLRRGLPRVHGGEPWPPQTTVNVESAPEPATTAPVSTAPVPAASAPAAPKAEPDTELEQVTLRRGMPRVAGGPPWPTTATVEVPVQQVAEALKAAEAAPVADTPAETPATEPQDAPTQEPAPAAPQPKPQAKPKAEPKPEPKPQGATTTEPKVYGRYTAAGWSLRILGGVLVLFILASMAVMSARYLVETTAWGQDFVAKYPGAQPLPDGAPVGMPRWLNWAHFFNMFFMVLIIRTGLQVRHERKPEAYWAPPWAPKKKISVTLWLHQCLDVLWVLNGLVFYVLLFATGHWQRIVPTSWETFPNALSSALQYLTLNWPLENGWVHYNSLQELAYFTTVFIAAPLAIASGFRMSSFWSDKWKGAGQVFSANLARKLHFPVMLYFAVFVVIHVALVLFTGARRNFAGMFAGQGSVDPSEYAQSWTGVLIFLGSLVLIALAWAAARPVFVAQAASLTGKVSNR